uniref:translocation/assembly module TamB domain-containing protein n=1 Tax=Castellaniella defragrans TaxID=75697 RepID=UPI003340A355
MRTILRGLRFFGLWVLPFLVTALLLLVGFAYWCVSSQPGTRWLLRTVAEQLDGSAQGVKGTLRDGVYVGDLSLRVPQADVRVEGLHLKVLWSELLERRLHVADLSADRADVALQLASEAPVSDEPFQMPALPVAVLVDRLALGGLGLRIDGEELPVGLLSLATAATLDQDTASLRLDRLQAMWGRMLLSVGGRLDINRLAAPWPLALDLQGFAEDRSEGSPLCLRRYLGQRPDPAESAPECRIGMTLHTTGDLEGLAVALRAEGEGLTLDAKGDVLPDRAFPLGQTEVTVSLPDGSEASASVAPAGDFAPAEGGVLLAHLALRDFKLGPWLPEGLGESRLTARVEGKIGLDPSQAVHEMNLRTTFDPASRWNGQALSGSVAVDRIGMRSGPLFDARAAGGFDLAELLVSGLDVAVSLGSDHLGIRGGIEPDHGNLDVQARLPELAALWPGLPGGVEGHAVLEGNLARQRLTLDAGYTPADAQDGVLGQAPVDARLRLDGGWVEGTGWRGTLSDLTVGHAGLSLRSEAAVTLELDMPAASADEAGGTPAPAGADWAWRVGRAQIDAGLDGENLLRLDHTASSGSGRHWATSGRVDSLLVTPERIEKLQAWLARGRREEGGVHTALSERARESRLESRLDWSLSFDDALSGDIHLARTGGNLVVPGDVPIELGLREGVLDVAIRRHAPGLSQVEADLRVASAQMGSLRVRAGSPLHALPGGGLGIRPEDVKTVHVEAVSEDLAWINLFLPGGVEVGGTIHADIEGRSQPDGRWAFNGPLRGEHISVLSVDQGVRLLDGTLQAHFDGGQVRLDSLRFPAVRRVTPKEWRTATWVSENPDAQNGWLKLSGQWDLFEQGGGLDIEFHRYPILQRSDRYAMITGALRIDSVLPNLDIRGKIVADAGWFDLDMLSNIPSLDSDVVILEPGQVSAPEESAPPLDIVLDLSVDLGPRFYLTGYGVNSGLVGELNLRMSAGKLTALGELRTRGGSLDAYGQHLQLRRGTVTFQGDITNPVIGIEALRTDVAVQAGVRVAGTARRPRIDLVSYPDVSETEKLTWLLLGHGPDESGGDMGLLFSVGSSLLSSGEPFYRRFGLDELSMRSGELGSTGSILPIDSVVSSQGNNSASDIERRFVVASRTITQNLKISLEQALSGTGTVARLSYRLVRNLRAELTAGTVNGLALVYRWFSMD